VDGQRTKLTGDKIVSTKEDKSKFNATVAVDAAYDLRERLVRNANTKAKLPRIHLFALIVKAYGSFVNGTRTGVLRLNEDSAFPKMP
jgi:hypothetical protein